MAWQELARVAADREAELEHAQGVAGALRAELALARAELPVDEGAMLSNLALLEERAALGSPAAALELAAQASSSAASSPQAAQPPAQPALRAAEPHDAAAAGATSCASVAGSPSRLDSEAGSSAPSAPVQSAHDATRSGAWTEAAVTELVGHMRAEHEAAMEALRYASNFPAASPSSPCLGGSPISICADIPLASLQYGWPAERQPCSLANTQPGSTGAHARRQAHAGDLQEMAREAQERLVQQQRSAHQDAQVSTATHTLPHSSMVHCDLQF
jgi:hypothetical protein